MTIPMRAEEKLSLLDLRHWYRFLCVCDFSTDLAFGEGAHRNPE